MTFQQEFSSWLRPKYVEPSPVPTVGVPAPSTEQLTLPRRDNQSTVIATDTWLSALDYSSTVTPNIQVVVDDTRTLYARWGLGSSSMWHVMSPMSMWSVYRLGKDEGIWKRPTESGSRWQTAGGFAIDGSGIVQWVQVAARADDVGELEEGVKSLLDQDQMHAKERRDSKL
ncbi:hypothetical protein MMC18_002930 [Xylographa bjoerkii]|nr:hypothetical protein [Xylographa bjoerkii]